MKLEGKKYRVELLKTESGIAVVGGFFGEVQLAYNELFRLRVKNVTTGEERLLTSLDGWGRVDVSENSDEALFFFSSAEACDGITVTVSACADEDGVSFGGGVENHNAEWSAMDLSYPTPLVFGDALDLFVPAENGLEIKNASNAEEFKKYIHGTVIPYPSRRMPLLLV